MSDVRSGWLSRLKAGLSKSSTALKDSISGIFVKKKLDETTLEELEEALIVSDLGARNSALLVSELAKGRFGKELSSMEIRQILAANVAKILEPVAVPLENKTKSSPQVVLVVGVNGVGKTTTIGKIANQELAKGRRVIMAACDTFRAAAVEQLQIWGNRNGCPVVTGGEGTDPAGLAFDALKRAQDESYDLLLVDTAGRLHNKSALMDELAKITRVIRKLDPKAPHDTLLVLDATTGQNAHNQVEAFCALISVSGLVVTKLDGTAKGGVVVALAEKFALPVHAIGVGESIDDLKPFEAQAFAESLLGIKDAA